MPEKRDSSPLKSPQRKRLDRGDKPSVSDQLFNAMSALNQSTTALTLAAIKVQAAQQLVGRRKVEETRASRIDSSFKDAEHARLQEAQDGLTAADTGLRSAQSHTRKQVQELCSILIDIAQSSPKLDSQLSEVRESMRELEVTCDTEHKDLQKGLIAEKDIILRESSKETAKQKDKLCQLEQELHRAREENQSLQMRLTDIESKVDKKIDTSEIYRMVREECQKDLNAILAGEIVSLEGSIETRLGKTEAVIDKAKNDASIELQKSLKDIQQKVDQKLELDVRDQNVSLLNKINILETNLQMMKTTLNAQTGSEATPRYNTHLGTGVLNNNYSGSGVYQTASSSPEQALVVRELSTASEETPSATIPASEHDLASLFETTAHLSHRLEKVEQQPLPKLSTLKLTELQRKIDSLQAVTDTFAEELKQVTTQLNEFDTKFAKLEPGRPSGGSVRRH